MQEYVISVSKLCGYIKNIFDNEELLHNISVYGEVSGLSVLRGNAYFNLKDADALLPCVYFGAFEELREGDKIIAVGSPNYYIKGGKLNFNVIKTKPYGVGELYQKFLEIKKKLEDEGLFALEYKKQLPQKIKRIGVVTSESGAVIQDIINIVTRRDDSIDIVLYPARVQGYGADNEIINGIKFFEDYNVDVIVVARGGGSFEDLNAFNSEKLARCVYDCSKFVMSAVGHETDYTIIDFVSDLRAPTPSAAAELLTNLKTNKKTKLINLQKLIENRVFEKICDESDFLTSTQQIIQSKVQNIFREKEYELALIEKTLEKHNTKEILSKGYAYIEKDNKNIEFKNLKIGDQITIVQKEGKIESVIKTIKGDVWKN